MADLLSDLDPVFPPLDFFQHGAECLPLLEELPGPGPTSAGDELISFTSAPSPPGSENEEFVAPENDVPVVTVEQIPVHSRPLSDAASDTKPGFTELASNPAASISSDASNVTQFAGMSEVEIAKKRSEIYANGKATERKRKLNRDTEGNSKRQKTGETSSCSDQEEGINVPPEKVSHRKYQKRLLKNRDSAYVSRIRRREYTRLLEESLDRTEKEKNAAVSRSEALQHKLDVVSAELAALKEATMARFGALGSAFSSPMGASVSSSRQKNTGTIVTTMFMFALMFGVMVPDSVSNLASSAASSFSGMPGFSDLGNKREEKLPGFQPYKQESKYRPGRVWGSGFSSGVETERHKGTLMADFYLNATQIFGKKNGKRVTDIVQTRLDNGTVSDMQLHLLTAGAKTLASQMEEVESAKEDRRRALADQLGAILRRLSTAADDWCVKELLTLLTVRLLPNESKRLSTLPN